MLSCFRPCCLIISTMSGLICSNLHADIFPLKRVDSDDQTATSIAEAGQPWIFDYDQDASSTSASNYVNALWSGVCEMLASTFTSVNADTNGIVNASEVELNVFAAGSGTDSGSVAWVYTSAAQTMQVQAIANNPATEGYLSGFVNLILTMSNGPGVQAYDADDYFVAEVPGLRLTGTRDTAGWVLSAVTGIDENNVETGWTDNYPDNLDDVFPVGLDVSVGQILYSQVASAFGLNTWSLGGYFEGLWTITIGASFEVTE